MAALAPIWPLLETFLSDFDQAAMHQTSRLFPRHFCVDRRDRREAFLREILTLCVHYPWTSINFSFYTCEVRLWQDSYRYFYQSVPFLSMFITDDGISCAGHHFADGLCKSTFRWRIVWRKTRPTVDVLHNALGEINAQLIQREKNMDLFRILCAHLAREDLKYAICGDVFDPQSFVMWMRLRKHADKVYMSLHVRDSKDEPDVWRVDNWEHLDANVSKISDTIMPLLTHDLTGRALICT